MTVPWLIAVAAAASVFCSGEHVIRHGRSRTHFTRAIRRTGILEDGDEMLVKSPGIDLTAYLVGSTVVHDVAPPATTAHPGHDGAPNLENRLRAGDVGNDENLLGATDGDALLLAQPDDGVGNGDDADDRRRGANSGMVDIVTRFLRIVESQQMLGENCTAGTDLNLGEGVVDRYAQERFRVEADVAVNRANMLTRLWKYAAPAVTASEYLLHASVFSMVEFDDDIFAAGNCYDQHQYKDYWLFCPYAYRLPEGPILVKDLAVEYKYLSNTSEWFYIARKNAENVIRNYNQFSRGYNTYTYNESAHTLREPDEILSVTYEDGKWSKPYYDCGGGNIWMLTYTVPFFGFHNDTYFFKGTSGIDIDLRRVDIDQCPLPPGSTQLNIFAASDKCKKRTTKCIPLPGLGFRRGSYKCVCRRGFYFPNVRATHRYYNGSVIEEEYEKQMMGEESQYSLEGMFECLQCAEGCESCMDDRPCVVSLNWVMRTVILILSCVIICCLPIVVLFTWKYGNVKVVRAASPVLLRVITLGAFFIYCTTIVMYPRPNIVTCTMRVWLREIGFSLTYGALMLKTWRISVIFRVRSAKAIKITDFDLLKRLGIIVAIFSVFLVIRTLVAPPHVIVGRTADDLKAYLCRTDWWDHSFTMRSRGKEKRMGWIQAVTISILLSVFGGASEIGLENVEVMFLVWGIRLCIVVRKAPSEFNESRFISMAIYNEFLLSVFLNVSMLFLQSPANPDLLYIIFFCHTQLTVTLLLCLIFGSKAYMVLKGHGKSDDGSSAAPRPQAAKFLAKGRSANSQCMAPSTNSSAADQLGRLSDVDVQEEFQRVYAQLELLKEKNMRLGNRHLAARISAMQEAARLSSDSALPEENSRLASITTPTPQVNSVLAAVAESLAGAAVPPPTPPQQNPAPTSTPAPEESVASNSTRPTPPDIEMSAASTVHKRGSRRHRHHHHHHHRLHDTAPVSGDEATAMASDSKASASDVTVASPADSRRNRNLKSGHARTHAIIINLDDKNRFTEEVTV